MALYGTPRPTPVPPWWRRLAGSRVALVLGASGVVLASTVAFGAVAMFGSDPAPGGAGGTGSGAGIADSAGGTSGGTVMQGKGAATAGQTITLSAAGDIIMGAAPGGLPPDDGAGFFDQVRDALRADLQMGNLEQPLTGDTGVSKCGDTSPGQANAPGQQKKRTCFAFRAPTSYAGVLKEGGFDIVTLANNHAYDFGPAGHANTKGALDRAGVRHTGGPGEITVVEAKGIRVAVIGFAPYAWAQSLVDIEAGADLVRAATKRADLVVVQAHMGGEGADKTHVSAGTEMFLGENRGDPVRFAHAMIDAGADLVIGHGPHVVRGMEFYQGRLIAYSLGNFAGYRALSNNGVLGAGAVLKVTLGADGSWHGGSLVPTVMVTPGVPRPDRSRQAVSLIRSLSAGDFPGTGAKIGTDGSIDARQP